MAKASSVWECQQCGSQFPKWAGKCPDCGQWNTLVETAVSTKLKTQNSKLKSKTQISKPQLLSEILKQQDKSAQRFSTGIGELDRVLGGPPSPGASAGQGGLVPGQVVLLAGEPGMGKSTLLSQVALQLSNSFQNTQKTLNAGKSEKSENQKTGTSGIPILRQSDISGSPSFPSVLNILYVCGEESPSQVALRLRRLSASPLTVNDSRLTLYPETDVDAVVDQIQAIKLNQSIPKRPGLFEKGQAFPQGNGLVIIDSIQTLSTADLSGLAGSVGQIRESTGRLSQVAKSLNIPLFLVGHVTKEGEVAGPKVLEHMVDTVLVMEGDRSGNLRILRSLKNRFGPVDEVGIFSMDDNGMREVKNPAELLVGDLAAKAPGSVLGCVLEGQRPLVLEVQSLAVPTKLSFPRRVGNGISERRLQLLCAVIEKHLGLGIGEKDVFVNVAGGLKSADPGLDLPVVAAIVSSASSGIKSRGLWVMGSESGVSHEGESPDSPTPSLPNSQLTTHNSQPRPPIFCGEVGLLGEVRQVPGWPRREKEVGRLGLGKLIGKAEIKHIGQLQKFLH